ncbi:DegT/DnrJ/EryC1/StrS aminotransferase family protein [Candidatus Saccharibacteria bacterium]|nr:DegT/DnrJ/EryC1/StrS aminotransferase family protein [Candidatus Saccharibacteria bacterium]
MKYYFLGLAANYSREERLAHTFTRGRKEDLRDLENFLTRKYGGKRTILTKNGRSALTLALRANFNEGDGIIVNGFTCYAVYEAIKEAGLVPIFADIDLRDLNFSVKELEEVKTANPKGIIVQNTLGNPVDIVAIEQFAKDNNLVIIEDLAHSAGIKYPDGRETGTVGVATVLSFGKDKAIDTISGGAVILRAPHDNPIRAPKKAPKVSDYLRSRLYPTFGVIARVLTRVHLGGIFMRVLVKIHWVEKSADNRLDLTRRLCRFEAARALLQVKSLTYGGERPLREFCFVKNRREVLSKLKAAGYYFDGFWYEKPVSPERYYRRIDFPEEKCKNAVYAAKHIVNLPTYYRKKELEPARKIIAEYLEEKK